MIERRQQSTATSQPDPDMAFLQSILPDMKAMDDRQKLYFKREILNLTEQIRYAQPDHKAGSSINAQSKSSSVNTLSRDSSIQTIECTSPKSIEDDANGGERFFNMQQQIEQEEDYTMERYLSFLPKYGSHPQK
ncbi:unnamed protein product [Acanthoscelides obtectus]|uniref:BESS domain-containing protein n=1 Tax=Acanthoscelides obtectus TaxID=200917 RepID=A0A9P0K8Y0_ACAOB|nr:unnamed protein product [Acanthoscelides obtectus]CAK1632619.1 hypothetical protein AOBTE_LOCUS7650 [Acanthoscelides obtectus]